MVRKRKGRSINGVLVLDKPSGITSNRALQEVKGIFSAAKAGHTGNLDPCASGVLPIFFGEATKFSQYLLNANKTYEATIVLGCSTETGDTEGNVVRICDASDVTVQLIERALTKLRGNIQQVPSMYSAIKHKGRRLYQLARAGEVVERKPRAINIFELELRRFRPGRRAKIDIFLSCSKGTYVRSLAEDIGSILDVGAHVIQLRRLAAGQFCIESGVSLDLIRQIRLVGLQELDALLLPMDTAVTELPKLWISELLGQSLRQGQSVSVPNAPSNGIVRLANENGEFVGLGEILDDGRVAPRRMVIGTSSSEVVC